MRFTDARHLYNIDGTLNKDVLERKVIIWGCGKKGKTLFEKITSCGGIVEAFCDSDSGRFGTDGFCGKEVIKPTDLAKVSDRNIIITFVFWPQGLDLIPGREEVDLFVDYPYYKPDGSGCILCGSHDTLSVSSGFYEFLNDRMFRMEPPDTRWMHCNNCELSYSSYRPTDEEMDRLYSDYRGEEYTEQRKKYEPWYSNDLFNEEANQYRRDSMYSFIKDGTGDIAFNTILDYGGDRGQFIPEEFSYAERYVYDISGNETVNGVLRMPSLEEAANHDWDLIMNCCTLEHVSYPDTIVERINSLMNGKTVFYLEVPCECHGMHPKVHEHINEFTKQTLKVIGELFSFETLKIGNVGSTGIGALYKKR